MGDIIRNKDISFLFNGYNMGEATVVVLDFDGVPPLSEKFFVKLFSLLGTYYKDGMPLKDSASPEPIRIKNLEYGQEAANRALEKVFG